MIENQYIGNSVENTKEELFRMYISLLWSVNLISYWLTDIPKSKLPFFYFCKLVNTRSGRESEISFQDVGNIRIYSHEMEHTYM